MKTRTSKSSRRIVQPARVELDRLSRLIGQHAAQAYERTGRMNGCRCDLCRQASKRLDKLRADAG
jgi:hypothetical protein